MQNTTNTASLLCLNTEECFDCSNFESFNFHCLFQNFYWHLPRRRWQCFACGSSLQCEYHRHTPRTCTITCIHKCRLVENSMDSSTYKTGWSLFLFQNIWSICLLDLRPERSYAFSAIRKFYLLLHVPMENYVSGMWITSGASILRAFYLNQESCIFDRHLWVCMIFFWFFKNGLNFLAILVGHINNPSTTKSLHTRA